MHSFPGEMLDKTVYYYSVSALSDKCSVYCNLWHWLAFNSVVALNDVKRRWSSLKPFCNFDATCEHFLPAWNASVVLTAKGVSNKKMPNYTIFSIDNFWVIRSTLIHAKNELCSGGLRVCETCKYGKGIGRLSAFWCVLRNTIKETNWFLAFMDE